MAVTVLIVSFVPEASLPVLAAPLAPGSMRKAHAEQPEDTKSVQPTNSQTIPTDEESKRKQAYSIHLNLFLKSCIHLSIST